MPPRKHTCVLERNPRRRMLPIPEAAGFRFLVMFPFQNPPLSLSLSLFPSSLIVLRKVRGTAGPLCGDRKLFKVSPHEFTQTVTLELIRKLFIQEEHRPFRSAHTHTQRERAHKHTTTGAPRPCHHVLGQSGGTGLGPRLLTLQPCANVIACWCQDH